MKCRRTRIIFSSLACRNEKVRTDFYISYEALKEVKRISKIFKKKDEILKKLFQATNPRSPRVFSIGVD